MTFDGHRTRLGLTVTAVGEGQRQGTSTSITDGAERVDLLVRDCAPSAVWLVEGAWLRGWYGQEVLCGSYSV